MSDTLVHPCAIQRESNHAGPDWMRITALYTANRLIVEAQEAEEDKDD